MYIYSYNNATLIVSALVDSGTIYSYISKYLVKNLNLQLVIRQEIAVTLADCSAFTCEEEVNAAYGIAS